MADMSRTGDDFPYEIPLNSGQRMQKDPFLKDGKLPYPIDSPKWFDREENKRLEEKYIWGVPYDPRFPQMNQSRKCFIYYQDYQRCINLLGEQYKPCKWFKNVYEEFCPYSWVEKFDGWIRDGKFPAYTDR